MEMRKYRPLRDWMFDVIAREKVSGLPNFTMVVR